MKGHSFSRTVAFTASILLAGLPFSARAEDPPPVRHLADASTVVGPEADVRITDTAGNAFRGRLVGLTGTSLQIRAGSQILTFEEPRIRRVEVYRSDSVLNGTLIGLAVGAGSVLALAYGLDRNEADEYGGAVALYAGIGAALGAGIDALIRGRHTVLLAEPQVPTVSFEPVLTPHAGGMRVAVKF
jgi:hypothetical protein